MNVERDFREYVTSQQTGLLRTAWLLTGDWAAAADLVQTALEKCWPKWSKIRSAGDPHAYVRQTLVRTSYSWRRLRRSGEIPHESIADSSRVADPADSAVSRLAVAAALASLPPRQRAVLVLRYFDDLTEQQTAAALRCSVGTVKSQASKGLAKLRRHPALASTTQGAQT